MRENVRDMRGMLAEDSRPILFASCRYELARSVPLLQHLPLAAELQVLRQEREAILQGRLLQVRKFFAKCDKKFTRAGNSHQNFSFSSPEFSERSAIGVARKSVPTNW